MAAFLNWTFIDFTTASHTTPKFGANVYEMSNDAIGGEVVMKFFTVM
jgi:hypothetical protein